MAIILSLRNYTSKQFNLTFTIQDDQNADHKITFPFTGLVKLRDTLNPKSKNYGKSAKVKKAVVSEKYSCGDVIASIAGNRASFKTGKDGVELTALNIAENIIAEQSFDLSDQEMIDLKKFIDFAVLASENERKIENFYASRKSLMGENDII